MPTRTLLASFMAICLVFSAQAQKIPLTHEVYDDWKSIQSVNISNDGTWAAYRIAPQVGDAVLQIRNLNTDEVITVDRVSNYRFSANGQYLAAEIKPAYDSTRMMKLKKVASSKMPKDSLYVITLASGEINKVARVKNYQLPADSENWVAWHHEKPAKASKKKEEKAEEEKKEETPEPEASEKKKGKGKKKKARGKRKKKGAEAEEETVEEEKKEKKPKSRSKGTELVLMNMATGESRSFEGVMDYLLSKDGAYLYFEKDKAHKESPSGVFALNTATGVIDTLSTGLTDYKKMEADESGKQLAFLATDSKKSDDDKIFSLMYWKAGEAEARAVADSTTAGLPADWMVSDKGDVNFSYSGERLFVGLAPKPIKYAYEEDSTLLKEDRPDVDVWVYNDPYVQPMQKNNLGREKNRTYAALVDLANEQLIPIETPMLQDVNIYSREDHDYYLATDDSPYRVQFTWDVQLPSDVYKVDAATGEAELLIEGIKGYSSLSPGGKYVLIYNLEDSHWYSLEVASKNLINLTEGLPVTFANELHDSPSLANPNGAAGWADNDAAVYLYDRYDIWKVDPSGKAKATNVTKGKGRDGKIRYRHVRLDREATTINTDEPAVVSVFNEWTKASGYARVDFANGSEPETLVVEDMRVYGLTKAKNADRVMVRKSTYREYPEVYVANDLDMTGLKKLSEVGKQIEPYNWGTAELIEFESGYDGEVMQAVLYKPENFDPNKKYPMIVYFYERLSQTLHSHRSPAPSASTVNIPYYVSNDYLVLVPDIKYEIGHPGRSAMNHVIPATKAVVAKGFVNEDKMAIQGQSWGGYQVAHIVTRTDMFAAAGAGAPVSNMTSAYGGVRWGSGMSRMFQYEKTQSRIGGTLWEKPELYTENSPIFHVPKINTPLFIMHNDADGAVPWYQGIEFYMSLRRLQKPAWMVVYNKEAHNLRQRKNRKDLSMRMGQFFDHFLKDAPMPQWMYGLPATLKNRTLGYELVEEPTEKPEEGAKIELEKKGN